MKASQNETSNFVALAAHRPGTDAVNTGQGMRRCRQLCRKMGAEHVCLFMSVGLEHEQSKHKCRLLGLTHGFAALFQYTSRLKVVLNSCRPDVCSGI